MPSAVLMGMGLTPKLALAEPLPKNPFRDGPCVTAPDKEVEEETRQKPGQKPEQKPGQEESGRERPGRDAKPGATPAPDPGATAPAEPPAGDGSGGAGSAPAPSPEGTGPEERQDAGTPESEPAPSETGTRNPLDPLGVGDAIKDLLTPDGKDGEPEPGASPSVSPSASPSASPSPSRTADSGSEDPVKDPVRDTVGGVADEIGKGPEGLEDTAERAGDAVEDTTGAVGGAREEAAGSPAADATPGADASGKEPFPCPTYDAQALADAEEERTEAVLPNAPWRLETSLLALHGLDYQGIVKVRTHNGTVKDVLKFTARSVDIRDLHQLVEGPAGTTAHVEAARGSTSTIRNGTVTMYTEELKGKLFGIIPVIFSPESPPPLNIPEVFFTEVTVRQAGQFGGELHIPGMNLYNEG
jgi:hypothetical protein